MSEWWTDYVRLTFKAKGTAGAKGLWFLFWTSLCCLFPDCLWLWPTRSLEQAEPCFLAQEHTRAWKLQSWPLTTWKAAPVTAPACCAACSVAAGAHASQELDREQVSTAHLSWGRKCFFPTSTPLEREGDQVTQTRWAILCHCPEKGFGGCEMTSRVPGLAWGELGCLFFQVEVIPMFMGNPMPCLLKHTAFLLSQKRCESALYQPSPLQARFQSFRDAVDFVTLIPKLWFFPPKLFQ